MIGGVIRHILPHLPGVPQLHVNRPFSPAYVRIVYGKKKQTNKQTKQKKNKTNKQKNKGSSSPGTSIEKKNI